MRSLRANTLIAWQYISGLEPKHVQTLEDYEVEYLRQAITLVVELNLKPARAQHLQAIFEALQERRQNAA